MDEYRVEPGTKVVLQDWDPRDDRLFDDGKKAGKKKVKELTKELAQLQRRLFADGRHAVLVVLQALDTGGKDSTTRHVFGRTNPQGVKVASFKTPTPQELSHDFLWRVHARAPARGEIGVFNRSHYEDVLIARVHELIPEAVWERRFEQINEFERMLASEGTVIRKLFLNISREEQLERLEARLDDPDRQWKFDPTDLEERGLWTAYLQAYEDVLSRTSTQWAPWYIVPGDRKWYRDIVVAGLLVDTLSALDLEPPALDPTVLAEARAALDALKDQGPGDSA